MRALTGAPAAPGAALGPAYVYRTAPIDPAAAVAGGDAAAEQAELEAALDAVADDLAAAAVRATGEAAEILHAQAAMARDPALRATAAAGVAGGAAAAAAVVESGDRFAAQLESSGNAYLAVRGADVRHICDAAARRLLGVPPRERPHPPAPSVLVTDDLSPADTAGLDRAIVLAIVTAGGSPTSHTAIVARGLGIPAVVAVRHLLDDLDPGTEVAVDGGAGAIWVEPDPATVERLGASRSAPAAAHARQRKLAGSGPVTTRDGRRIEVAANIRSPEELAAALEEGAEAVGLLRTELLYVDRCRPPTLEEQTDLLRRLRSMLGGRRLVVRTFDIGSDKPVPFLPARPERNPELGLRGLRLAMRHPDLLDIQLRAVAAVADLGPTAVMAPMVGTVAELEWFLERVTKITDGAPLEVGVMVEIPSAVLLAGEFAERVDFLSIGTNDLTQYLMAADRRHGDLAELQDPFQPAVLRAVQKVCHEADGRCWVGVCGEAASRPAWALLAVGLGVQELSMQAASIPAVQAAVRSARFPACQAAAERAVAGYDRDEARAAADELLAEASEP
jgi:phosphotransferase system enzyme I (PtsI)